MQFLLHAYDFTDEFALERRFAARPQHFEGARVLKNNGNFVLGGALLSESGTMIGSMMLLEFESELELQVWLETEPYVTGRVWERIDVKSFQMADV